MTAVTEYQAAKHPFRLARRAAWLRDHNLDATPLEAALNNVGRCRLCGRALTNAKSVELGIGSECRRGQKETP